MTDVEAPSALADVALLERAVGLLLASLRLGSRAELSWPTPCAAWNLGQLLAHVEDSLGVLREAADVGSVGLQPSYCGSDGEIGGGSDVVMRLRTAASGALGAWTRDLHDDPAVVGGRPLAASLVATTGALEIAVHAWDIAAACGVPLSFPEALADDLLLVARQLVLAEDRPLLFARPLAPEAGAGAGERLLAFLGRPIAWPRDGGLRSAAPAPSTSHRKEPHAGA